MDEEYWGEPDIYELGSEVDAFKRKLIDSARQEIKDRFQKLESENAEMKTRLKSLDQLEADAKAALRKAEVTMSNAERNVKFRKAKELFKELSDTKYLITYRQFYKDMCGKCVDRKVEFTYPSGKVGYETCELCGGLQTEKMVVEAIGTEVDIRNGDLMIWYAPYRSWDDGESHSMHSSVKTKYTGQPYEELNEYSILFDSKEEAQKYADYLNEKTPK